MLKLISALPSPYARKVRIALFEKGIPFELITETPWESTTQTPRHNPLEKLPILLTEQGEALYESHFILEWLETYHPDPPLLAAEPAPRLRAKQVEVVADGICDALVLLFWESQRDPDKQSLPWMERQMRKVDGGMRALAGWVSGVEFIVGDRFGLADIAAATVCRYLDIRYPDYPWRTRHPALADFSNRMERRSSFRATLPMPQSFNEPVV